MTTYLIIGPSLGAFTGLSSHLDLDFSCRLSFCTCALILFFIFSVEMPFKTVFFDLSASMCFIPRTCLDLSTTGPNTLLYAAAASSVHTANKMENTFKSYLGKSAYKFLQYMVCEDFGSSDLNTFYFVKLRNFSMSNSIQNDTITFKQLLGAIYLLDQENYIIKLHVLIKEAIGCQSESEPDNASATCYHLTFLLFDHFKKNYHTVEIIR